MRGHLDGIRGSESTEAKEHSLETDLPRGEELLAQSILEGVALHVTPGSRSGLGVRSCAAPHRLKVSYGRALRDLAVGRLID